VTQQTGDKAVHLTQDAFDKLQSELEHLRGPVRDEIIARISAARDEGDLKENGGYHAAREEQGKNEARIRQLEEMIEKAQIIEPPKEAGLVAPGMRVTTRFVGDDDVEEFLFGSREIEAPDNLAVYSPDSPLGSAIDGKKAGDVVEFDAPNGKTLKVEIVDAVPFTG
jgi:transcription elongation factor GreA